MAMRGSFVSVRRVIQVRLDCRRRPSKPPGDLGDREPLLVAVVARERRSPAPFTYTITCGHAGDDSGRSRRLPNELDSRRWYSETMLGSVVTSKAEHRRFPRIRKSRRVPIRDLALPAVVQRGSGWQRFLVAGWTAIIVLTTQIEGAQSRRRPFRFRMTSPPTRSRSATGPSHSSAARPEPINRRAQRTLLLSRAHVYRYEHPAGAGRQDTLSLGQG
jgi:hypothetical protein